MKFHKSVRTLSIYSFNELVKSNDLRFLLASFDQWQDEDLILSIEEIKEAKQISEDIFYQYAELTNNYKMLAEYKAKFIIVEAEYRYDVTLKVLEFYLLSRDVEILDSLNKLQWKFDKNENIDEQLQSISQSMRGLKTKLDLLKVKFKNKYGAKEDKKEEAIKFVDRLDKEAIELELGLKLNYSINTKLTTVSRWVNMCNMLTDRNSKLKQ